MDIITHLGESHYVSCGKGAITARRCLKQRHIELGFTKMILSDRAVYINNLVTLGPAKAELTARVIEHAKKRKRQRKTSKQKTASEAKKQMTAMGIIAGEAILDSPGGDAIAGEEADSEIREKQKRGKLLTICKWRLAQFNMADAREGAGSRGTKWEDLSQFVDGHNLHGMVLQGLRVKEHTTAIAQKDKYKERTLLMYPVHKEI